jgi:two-component system, NtrC family, sensor histidine kinase PilS
MQHREAFQESAVAASAYTGMRHSANHLPREIRETFWGTLQTFCVTRIVIVLVLLVYLVVNTFRENSGGELAGNWASFVVYLLLAIGFAMLSTYWRRRFVLQLVMQVMADIGAISILYIVAGGVRSGLAILYLFPLAGAAILAPLILALFFVSVVTLVLLTESGYQLLHSIGDTSPSHAGLYGAAFFAAIYVINRLAASLIKQEDLAAQRGRDLRLQEEINRLVITDMDDGILVVGRSAEVFAVNPAAERMLGLSIGPGHAPSSLTAMPSLAPIADAFAAWQAGAGRQTADASAFVKVKPADGIAPAPGSGARGDGRRELAAHLKLRFVTVKAEGLVEDRAVIFMQDVTEIENQAQQLKLASMGRLTASIAHEVRNPLSAISHASSLLREDVSDPAQTRLLNIVGDNVVRLNRMIEDILKLSRKAQSPPEPLALGPYVAALVEEFVETYTVPAGLIVAGEMDGYQVRFDPLHLREVVGNLLSNALRYASGRPGSIRIRALSPKPNRLELHVQDDGPAIAPEVRAQLFEPFYTTSSKGTGLGLYLARELCLNNGAILDYEYRMDMSNQGVGEPSGRFVITFSLPAPLLKSQN